MAKKYIIELETKADGTIGTLDSVANSLESVANAEQKVAQNTQSVTDQLAKLKEQLAATEVNSDQYKELSAQYEKLGGKISDLVPKTQNLKQEQRELKKALLAGQEALGTEKYTALTQRLGEVNDQLKDIAESAGQNAGPPLENLKNISGGLTDRLKNLDFEGLSQDVRNFAGNIKNVSFKGIIDGVKGLGGAFSSLGKALLANPIFAIAAAIIAIALAAKAFIDGQREDVDKLNEAQDKATERRKDAERLAFAQAAGNSQKITQLKLESNQKDLSDTKAKIDRLTNLQRSYVGISEDQEKQLAELRDKYRTQEIDREIIKVEAINALNAKRVTLQEQFNLVGLNERERAVAQLTTEYNKQQEELKKLNATEEDFDKLGTIFVDNLDKLKKGFADTDKAAAKSASDKAKATADALKSQQDAVNEAIRKAQEELRLSTASDQQKELAAVEEKYKQLKDQAIKAKVDTAQIVELQGKEEQAIREKYAKQLVELTKKAREEQQAELEALIEENLTAQKGAQQAELDALGEVYFEKITILENEGEDATALKEEYEKKRKAITDKYAQEEVDKEKERQQAVLTAQNAGLTARQQQLNNDLAVLKADYEARIALAKKFGQDSTALEEEYVNKQKELRIKAALETTEQWLKAAGDVVAAFTSLNEKTATELATKLSDLDKQIEGARTAQQRADLIKRRTLLEAEQKKTFEKNKKLQIAGAIVNTAASAVAAFGSQLVVGDPTSAIRGGIAAAAAVAAGAAQIAKIKATQFESSQPPTSSSLPDISGGGGGGGTGGGGGGESTTPGFNPLVLDFLNNRPEQQTPRAYVLAGDVEKATQARDRVEELARL
jgi:hypothetical protein